MKATTQKALKIATKTDWLRQWMPIGLILLFAAALYLYQLGTESLWADELYSILDAQEFNFSAIRPLYYILLRVWMQFGTSDAWLRGLSVIFGLGSVFLIYLLGCRIAGKPTGSISALLLTLSPLFLDRVQEVRMYALSTCLTLGGTLVFTYVLDRPKNTTMAWWVGTRLLAILTTPLNVILLLPDIVLFGWKFRHQRRLLLTFGKFLLLLGILLLPSTFATIAVTPEFVSDWIATQPAPGVFDVLFMLTRLTGWSFTLPVGDAIALFYEAVYFKLYALMLICLLGIALLDKRKERLIWVAAWAFLPSAFMFVGSHISTSFWVDRYLLFFCPYILILLAAGFTRIWQRQRTVAIVLALIYTLTTGSVLVQFYATQQREDWRSVAQAIATHEQPGDIIAYSSPTTRPLRALAMHYYKGSASFDNIESLARISDRPAAERVLSTLPPIQSRLWLIVKLSQNEGKQRQIFQAVMKDKFQVEKSWQFQRLKLFLLSPSSISQK